ncbi:hypothetical protein [Porphyrobacter sp. YT40]|uniref:hypothetical protein n=1 Tax=Porphyrobacter sp. YT40 TaxID=2547601 RepID=UPI001141CDB9|nr:hypothetical protein [Porphyrobacter sp. YT40]QDH33585.1 hypothetical protein E2E27_04065 [Porphyrobacter sp. YT40]
MFLPYLLAALAAQVATEPQVQVGPQVPPQQSLRLPPPREATRLPQRASPDAPPEPERIPIDLGPDAPTSGPPQQIDLLAEPPRSEAADAVQLKECEEQREAGVVAGEIVVCRELPADTSQIYSGSREAWLKDYAERTMNAGTIPPPDVAGPGIFRGPPTVSGLCLIGPCPKDPALIIDVEAIPPAPAGSDAERVAQGLEPLKDDNAPLSDEARRRVEEELGLPEVPER